MSARPTRREIERSRLDEMAAEAYADAEGVYSGTKAGERVLLIDDFLAGVAYERRRTRLVWRRQAPDWLKLTAAIVIAVLGFAAVYLMLLALSLAPI